MVDEAGAPVLPKIANPMIIPLRIQADANVNMRTGYRFILIPISISVLIRLSWPGKNGYLNVFTH